jgi:cytochrome c oxidase assembly protein subunit 15
MTHGTKTLILLTAIMGGFVAGLDAGLVYNSWPKFADKWIPENMLVKTPAWRNFFENEVTAQFMHRNLVSILIPFNSNDFQAYLTLVSITMTWLAGRRMKLGPRAKIALHVLLLAGYAQAMLGIYTLVRILFILTLSVPDQICSH